MHSDKEKIKELLSMIFDFYYGHLKNGYVLTAQEYEDTKDYLICSGIFEGQLMDGIQVLTPLKLERLKA